MLEGIVDYRSGKRCLRSVRFAEHGPTRKPLEGVDGRQSVVRFRQRFVE